MPTARVSDFTGSREERGDGPGEGFNHNLPLPPGTEDGAYCGELRKGVQVIDDFDPACLIVRYARRHFDDGPITMTNAWKPGSGHVRERPHWRL